MFLEVISDEDAAGEVAEIYRSEQESRGYVMEATRALSTRPDILTAWGQFIGVARDGSSLSGRDWRLITLIAAKHIRSTYCSLVYGTALVSDLGSQEKVIAVQQDFRSTDLSARDVAMLEYAEKVTVDAPGITEHDIEKLRHHGFSDQQIFDIALCSSLRNFISRLFDAVGATPDEPLLALEPSFREPLSVGRPTGISKPMVSVHTAES